MIEPQGSSSTEPDALHAQGSGRAGDPRSRESIARRARPRRLDVRRSPPQAPAVRPLLLLALLSLATSTARAQDVASMPDTSGLPPASASACARGDARACVEAGDAAFRLGDGARWTTLYRRAADLERHALHVPSRGAGTGRVQTSRAAIAALEAQWDVDVVRAAGRRGQRSFAQAARPQLFGTDAVSTWRGERARIADAFAAVYAWTEREGGAFASAVWIGDLRRLAADGPCWLVRFAYMNLDFDAYIDPAGRVIALVHIPEG